MCTGNNACSLSTPLLLRSRLSDNCAIQSFGHCSAQCTRLGSACLGSFLENEQLLYLLVPDPHLDRAFICILCTSPHVAPAWISHQARWGFLHGNSLLFCFCIGCDDTCDSCISIHQAQSFPIELVLWLVRRTLGSLSRHMVPIIPHGLLVSFDTVACVSTTSPVCSILSSCNIMQHHSTFPFRRLYWCAWCVASITLIGFSSISPRYA